MQATTCIGNSLSEETIVLHADNCKHRQAPVHCIAGNRVNFYYSMTDKPDLLAIATVALWHCLQVE